MCVFSACMHAHKHSVYVCTSEVHVKASEFVCVCINHRLFHSVNSLWTVTGGVQVIVSSIHPLTTNTGKL